MLFSSGSTLAAGAARLRSVRRSLNTPVAAIAELPIGPAAAAIASHEDANAGAAHWSLAVRSERTRQIVYFSARESSGEPSLVADAALSLAEGMGFLFDESALVASRSASGCEAQRVWQEFLEPDPVSAAGAPPPRGEAAASQGVGLTKFRCVLSRVGRELPAAGGPASTTRPSAAGQRPRRRKRAWRGFLWRSTE